MQEIIFMSAVVHIKAGLLDFFWKLIFSVKATKFEQNVKKYPILFCTCNITNNTHESYVIFLEKNAYKGYGG